jgi:hypothetical protein
MIFSRRWPATRAKYRVAFVFGVKPFGFYCHQDGAVAELPVHLSISSAASFI